MGNFYDKGSNVYSSKGKKRKNAISRKLTEKQLITKRKIKLKRKTAHKQGEGKKKEREKQKTQNNMTLRYNYKYLDWELFTIKIAAQKVKKTHTRKKAGKQGKIKESKEAQRHTKDSK